ncbi:MAG: NifB/NifX family molybdenum-iron cluster-binding protein [Spirochaetota bacterium]
MTICITTATTDPPARLDSRFGRSLWFTFYDTETGTSTVERNDLAGGASGVGAQVAQLVAERGAQAVVTGQVGPSAFAVLKAAGVAAYTTSATTVDEAVELFGAGKLEAAGAPTGPGHHGGGRGG